MGRLKLKKLPAEFKRATSIISQIDERQLIFLADKAVKPKTRKSSQLACSHQVAWLRPGLDQRYAVCLECKSILHWNGKYWELP
jgi:hypothetical protein